MLGRERWWRACGFFCGSGSWLVRSVFTSVVPQVWQASSLHTTFPLPRSQSGRVCTTAAGGHDAGVQVARLSDGGVPCKRIPRVKVSTLKQANLMAAVKVDRRGGEQGGGGGWARGLWCAARPLRVHACRLSSVGCRILTHSLPIPAQPEPAHAIFIALFDLQQCLGVARTPPAQVHADDLSAECCSLHLAGDDASGDGRCRLLMQLDAATDVFVRSWSCGWPKSSPRCTWFPALCFWSRWRWHPDWPHNPLLLRDGARTYG